MPDQVRHDAKNSHDCSNNLNLFQNPSQGISPFSGVRYVIGARNPGLTQAAGIGIDVECLTCVPVHVIVGVAHAFLLVVTGLAERIYWAARDTLAAGTL